MSADNGIYILKTTRNRRQEGAAWVQSEPHFVYRVAHVQAIDNFEWYKNHQTYNLGAYMKESWGHSIPHIDENAAFSEAHAEAKTIENLEYGVSVIDASDMVFYGDM